MSKIEVELKALKYRPIDEAHLRAYADPVEVGKLVRRLRGVKFFVRTTAQLITERPDEEGSYNAYDLNYLSVPVSAAVLMKHLCDLSSFNERKIERGKRPGLVEVTRHGDCLFVH